MPFISQKASAIVSGGGNAGGYLTASKLTDGGSMRIAIVSEEPLEFFTVWGEDEEGNKKPFRFLEEPTSDEIQAEMGEFKQRMNYEGTQLEEPKFSISMFVFDYEEEDIKILDLGQKTLIKELDKISQTEDYANIHDWDFTISRTGLKKKTQYSILPGPRKKGYDSIVKEAWDKAQSDGYDLQQLLVGGNPFGGK